MDTKTRKQEALDLLALDTLTYEQAERLNYLTATAAGMNTFYDPDNLFSEFTASRDWVRTGYHDPDNNNMAHELPEYCTSVDACIALPLPDGCWWLMTSRAPNTRCSAAIVLERHRQYAATIPLAMLKCFWAIQD